MNEPQTFGAVLVIVELAVLAIIILKAVKRKPKEPGR